MQNTLSCLCSVCRSCIWMGKRWNGPYDLSDCSLIPDVFGSDMLGHVMLLIRPSLDSCLVSALVQIASSHRRVTHPMDEDE